MLLFDTGVYDLFVIKVFKSSVISLTLGNNGSDTDSISNANKIWSKSGCVPCVFEILPGSSGRILLDSPCNWLKNNALSFSLSELK